MRQLRVWLAVKRRSSDFIFLLRHAHLGGLVVRGAVLERCRLYALLEGVGVECLDLLLAGVRLWAYALSNDILDHFGVLLGVVYNG